MGMVGLPAWDVLGVPLQGDGLQAVCALGFGLLFKRVRVAALRLYRILP